MGHNDMAGLSTTVMSTSSKYAPPEVIADKVALLSDGTLLVADTYLRDANVQSYYTLCRRQQSANQLVPVTLERLQAVLTNGTKVTNLSESNSSRQNEVLSRIRNAVGRRASDIHFVNGERLTTIKYRIDGVLHKVDDITVEDGMALCSTMYESMTDGSSSNSYKAHKSQDGRIAKAFLNGISLTGSRIATRPLETNNLFVLRLLYPGSGVADLAKLGYFKEQIALIHRMMRRDGVNLFSGVTGSGKSTSLMVICQLILMMFEHKVHLLTIEDPPEYFIPGAVQTQLKYDPTDAASIGPAWAAAIANAMRLDPDYMMVGELRDLASTMAAIQAAMTGHGLWTTTHAKNAFASLDRLADLGVPIGRLTDASLFTGLINQSLVPVLCTHPGCARSYTAHSHELSEDVRERVKQFCEVEKVRIRCAPSNTDCPVCGGLGYYQRTVAAEVVQPTQHMMDVYRASGSAAARSHWVKKMGGMTALAHVVAKINSGVVDPVAAEEAMHRGLDEDVLTLA